MEVRLNNIPKLGEYVIRLVVLNERMLGYIYPDKTSFVVALAVEPGDCVSLLDAINMRRYVSFDDKVRWATERDFDDLMCALRDSVMTRCICTIRALSLFIFSKFY